jgi:hypothetical protein
MAYSGIEFAEEELVRRHHHYYVTALPKQVRSRSKFAAVCFDVLQNVNVKDQIELMSHYAGDRSPAYRADS